MLMQCINITLKVVDGVKQEDIIRELNRIGVSTTRQTIARYEEQGLIPKADRSNRGQPGKSAEYPAETVEEFIASNRLLSGKYGDEGFRELIGGKIAPPASPKAIATARLEALRRDRLAICEDNGDKDGAEEQERYRQALVDFSDIESQMGWVFIDFLSLAWMREREKARRQIAI